MIISMIESVMYNTVLLSDFYKIETVSDAKWLWRRNFWTSDLLANFPQTLKYAMFSYFFQAYNNHKNTNNTETHEMK